MKKSDSKKKEDKNKKDNPNLSIYERYNIIAPENVVDTDEKRESINQLRNHPDVAEYIKEEHNDDFLARWLISRNWDVDKAAEMFVTSMKWRIENNIDTIVEEYPSDPYYQKIKDFWPGSETGVFNTKDGWPIYYERVGIVNFKYLLNNVAPREELLRYHIFEQESRERLRRKLFEEHGFTIGGVFVQDLGGLGWKHLNKDAMDILKQLTVIDQGNFPEAVRKMYVVNAPNLFNIAWKVIKPSLDKRILSKLAIGNNYQAELKNLIPVEELPIWAGGENPSVADPPAFHKQENDGDGEEVQFDIPEESLERLKIPRAEKIRLPMKIKSKNTMIYWRFIIEENDIGFYITFKRNEESEEKTVLESQKLEGSHEGSYLAKRRGTYTLVFDNSSSLFTKKSIKYQTYTQKVEKVSDTYTPVMENGDDDPIEQNQDD